MAAPSPVDDLWQLDPDERPAFVDELNRAELESLLIDLYDWRRLGRPEQVWPPGAWKTWLIQAGRGWGKTRAGAETTRAYAIDHPGCRMLIAARTASDLRDVCIEGISGVLAISPPWDPPRYEPSKRRLSWPNGSQAILLSADEPDLFRGPQYEFAWLDELASWKRPEAFDNVELSLRLGNDPRKVVTTTPAPVHLVRELVADPDTVITGGSTMDNPALPKAFLDRVLRKYGGTTKGRQEIYGELLDQVEGALWRRDWIERARVSIVPDLERIVTAVDPAVSTGEDSDETGIVTAGSVRLGDSTHFYVLDDRSGRYSPRGWGNAACAAYSEFRADRIVGERNNGGDLVEANLATIDPSIPVTGVWASRGKYTRAEPIASLYEQGRVHHVGIFPELEDSLTNWVQGQGESPDRLDATVWAMTELLSDEDSRIPDLSGQATIDRRSPWRM